MQISGATSNGSDNQPVVCVVIPCHNHGNYISRAIQSVVSQDYPKVMLSVINDGSTDNSLENINNFLTNIHEEKTLDESDTLILGQHENTPIILIDRKTASGQSAARNTCLMKAWKYADLFCMLDADDLYLPGKISKSVKVIGEAPNHIGLVYSDAIIYDERNGTKIREFRHPYERTLLERENIISNAPLVSKMALGYSGVYDETITPCEDWDLWLRITEHFVAIHIPEALQQYTVTGQNCTFTMSQDKWNEHWIKVQEKMRKRKKLRNG